MLQEATAFDHERCTGGLTMNLRFSAEFARGAGGLDAIEELMAVYFARGGLQLQLNVIGSETLRQAQAEPARYADLVVRVSGFSARFVTLSRRIQDEIVARVELCRNGKAGG